MREEYSGTVKDVFNREGLDLELLEYKMDRSSYAESCIDFLNSNWNRKMSSLSSKQISWILKILEDHFNKEEYWDRSSKND